MEKFSRGPQSQVYMSHLEMLLAYIKEHSGQRVLEVKFFMLIFL
jgi:hypothetical protein